MSELAHKPDSTLPIDVTAANNPDTLHGDPFICARKLSDLRNIAYPEGITGIQFDLDKDAENGLFRYDRDFLLQFMPVCEGRPSTLAPLEDIGLAPSNDKPTLTRAQPPRQVQNEAAPSGQEYIGQAHSSRTVTKSNIGPSNLLGRHMDYIPAAGSEFASGERFALSNAAQPASASSGGTLGMKSLVPITHCPTPCFAKQAINDIPTTGTTASPPETSKGSALANVDGKVMPVRHPAVASRNATSADRGGARHLVDVGGSIKTILGDLTTETFGTVLERLILWANKSEHEQDCHTLKEAVRVVFEEATADDTKPEICTNLLKAMEKNISHAVHDDNFMDGKGNHVIGSVLFRKHITHRMWDDFHRIWAERDAAPRHVARNSKVSNDNMAFATDPKGDGTMSNLERQLILFAVLVGELSRKRMTSSSKVAKLIKELLSLAKHEDRDIVPLCILVRAAGNAVKGKKGGKKGGIKKTRRCLDLCMKSMEEWCRDPSITQQTRETMMQVIQLHEHDWVTTLPYGPDGASTQEAAKPSVFDVVEGDDESDRKAEGGGDADIQDGADPMPGPSSEEHWTESVADVNREDRSSTQKTVVEFLERLVAMRLCSVGFLPSHERSGVTETIVEEIASQAPDAFRKLTLMIRGGELD